MVIVPSFIQFHQHPLKAPPKFTWTLFVVHTIINIMLLISKIRNYYRTQKYIKTHTVRDNAPSHKLRLSILTGQLAAGGVERVLLSIIKGLPQEEFAITIYITDFSNNVWIDKFKPYATIVHVTKELDWSTDQRLIDRYLSYSVTFNKADVLFITNSESGYRALPRIHTLNRLRLKKHPRIYDLLHTHGTPAENDAFLRISHPFDKYITKRIVISNYLQRYLRTKYHIKDDRISVIYNGLPTQSPTQSTSAKTADVFATDPDVRIVSYVGRLQSDKSPERLVELAHAAKTTLRQKNAVIAVIGDGELRAYLEEKSREYGILNTLIRFYGFTDTPEIYMAQSHFTILTSNLEGMPMSLLESMNLGTPAIAPNVGGIPEIIADQTGILVDFANHTEEDQKMLNLRHGLDTALNLSPADYNKICSNAKSHIDANFKHMEASYLELFKYGTLTQ